MYVEDKGQGILGVPCVQDFVATSSSMMGVAMECWSIS
jgi:hypothetical protein